MSTEFVLHLFCPVDFPVTPALLLKLPAYCAEQGLRNGWASVRPSVRLSHDSLAALRFCGFAAVGQTDRRYRLTAAAAGRSSSGAAARRSAANASSVTLTADVGGWTQTDCYRLYWFSWVSDPPLSLWDSVQTQEAFLEVQSTTKSILTARVFATDPTAMLWGSSKATSFEKRLHCSDKKGGKGIE